MGIPNDAATQMVVSSVGNNSTFGCCYMEPDEGNIIKRIGVQVAVDQTEQRPGIAAGVAPTQGVGLYVSQLQSSTTTMVILQSQLQNPCFQYHQNNQQQVLSVHMRAGCTSLHIFTSVVCSKWYKWNERRAKRNHTS